MEIRKQLSLDERRAKATAWALTFADMVTLLLTFFVLLLVILNDAEKHIDRVINRLLDETYEELIQNVSSSYVSIERVTKGIKITLTGSKLFKSLSADLNPEADPILVQIGGLIRTSTLMNIYKQKRWLPLLNRISDANDTLNIEIRAEGHTDDKPIPMNSKFRNNWELSSARALNLVQRLSELAEMDQHYFSALGYGEFRPKITINNIKNRSELEEARAQNRRVEIYFDAFIRSKNESIDNI